MWNELIKIRDGKSTSQEDRNYAKIILRQINTAGGKEIMGHEAEFFINKFKTKEAALQLETLLINH